MKTIVISDTHLTHRFNKRKYNFLTEIIESADEVIINGDFWDSWHTNFNRFLNSKWQQLFPLLREKSATYIYGNHDPIYKNDERTKLFSTKNCKSHTLKINEKSFFFIHGDKQLKNMRPFTIELYCSGIEKIEGLLIGNLFYKFLDFLKIIGIFILGVRKMTETKIAKHSNLLLKLQKERKNQWLVCGDTHYAEIDQEYLFANSGSIGHGLGSYLIIEDGKIDLIKERY